MLIVLLCALFGSFMFLFDRDLLGNRNHSGRAFPLSNLLVYFWSREMHMSTDPLPVNLLSSCLELLGLCSVIPLHASTAEIFIILDVRETAFATF